MGLLTGVAKLVGSNKGIIGKITNIANKAVIDKDKRNELVYDLALLMLSSKIAPYIRGVLGVIVVVSILFFGDKLTITPETQQYALYSVLGYYFLDRVFDTFKKK